LLTVNLQLLINGLAMGCIYALVGLGFVMVYRATRCVNFAQGEFVMLGAYLMVTFVNLKGFNFFTASLATVLAMGLFGLVYQRLVYHPLRKAPFQTVLVSTLGASVFLINLAMVSWSPVPYFMNLPFRGQMLNLAGGFAVNLQHLLILGVTVALIVLQYVILEYTFVGKKIQATAQDQDVAALIGINTSLMIAFTFMYAAMIGAVAGILVAPVFFITTQMGRNIYLKSLCATIAGGFGNVPGVILGGLLIGVVELFLSAYVSSLYRDAFAFGIILLILMLRPRGFFGELISEKV
jgi:branched-chain amino acid transport system permease protein